jgi:hypothetical protein
MAVTPPSLLGIDRRIAYAHRKYHSGLIWIGVTSGFARIKFSGSVKMFGINIAVMIKRIRSIINPNRSFEE